MSDAASPMRMYRFSGRGRPPRGSTQGWLCALILILGTPVGLWLLYDQPTGTAFTTQAPASSTPGSAALDQASHPLPAVTPPLRRHMDLAPRPIAHCRSRADDLRAQRAPTRRLPAAPAPDDGRCRNRHRKTVGRRRDRRAVRGPWPNPFAEPATALSLPPLPARDIPLPQPRPGSFLPAYQVASRAAEPRLAARTVPPANAPATPGDRPGFFERLFGAAREPSSVLAYARARRRRGWRGRGTGGFLLNRAGPERTTAVYNIAAHTVTLPDGTKLEAHSGLGASLDDPRSVTQHMRGATPPNVYDLEPRAAPFHGVRALRLNPVGGTTYGRLGLLAHTFMLGPRGESNGCVVFRNYQAFLAAYETGQGHAPGGRRRPELTRGAGTGVALASPVTSHQIDPNRRAPVDSML